MDDVASIITQQGELARRRKLLEAMQGQNMATQIQGGGKGYGIGQALAKIATAYLLSKQGGDLADQENTNRTAYQGALQGELSNYLSTRDGQPAQEMSGPMPDGTSPLMSPEVKASPREAVVRAMASQFPELQAIGKSDFAGLNKQPEEKFGHEPRLVMGPDGKPMNVLIGDRGTIRPMTGYQPAVKKEATAGGQVWDPYSGQKTGYVGEQFGPVEAKGTNAQGQPLIGQADISSGKVAWAPQGTNVNIDTSGSKVALNNAPKVFESARDSMLQSQQGLSEARRLMALSGDPKVAAGFAAGPQGIFQAIGAKLGVDPTQAASATQALTSAIAAQTLEASKELKGAISEKEKPFLEQARAGQMQYTPQALQYLAGLSMAVNHNRLLNSVQQYNSAASVEGAEPIARQYPMPALGAWEMPSNQFVETVNGRVRYSGTPVNPMQAKGSSAQNPLSVQEWLAQQGGR